MNTEDLTKKKTFSLVAIVAISAVTALGVTYAANNVKAVRNIVR